MSTLTSIPSLAVAITLFPRVLLRGVWRVDTSVVALVRRGKPPGVGLWSLPGGRVNWGEPLAVAAVRELEEELGVRSVTLVEPSSGVPSFATTDALHDGRFHYGIAHVLALVDAVDGALPTLTAGDDAAAGGWFACGGAGGGFDVGGGRDGDDGLGAPLAAACGGFPRLDSAALIGPVQGVLVAARAALSASGHAMRKVGA